MKKLIGARIEQSTIDNIQKLIDQSGEKYRDRTHVIKVAIENLLILEGVLPNEQHTRKTIP